MTNSGTPAQNIKRRMDLRKNQKVHLETQIEQARGDMQQTVIRMAGALMNMSQEIIKLKQKNSELQQIAQGAAWRSLAIQKLLPGFGITEEQVSAKANELLVADFEVASHSADVEEGLVEVTAKEAQPGLVAIASLKAFKSGIHIPEMDMMRTRFKIGGKETFPEISDAATGMKVGDVKSFSLSVQGETDTCEITLLGLRESSLKETTNGVTEENPKGEQA